MVPSALKSKLVEDLTGSGSVASSLTDGVHDNHRLELDADSRACAVILFFQFVKVLLILMQKKAPFGAIIFN